MIIIDGGLGLLKLTVLRVTKSKTFMKNIRTPIHDHARKNKGWSDTQVVTRFTLLQILLCVVVVILVISRSLKWLSLPNNTIIIPLKFRFQGVIFKKITIILPCNHNKAE